MMVQAEQERSWLAGAVLPEANTLAIEAYNRRVSRDGLLSDEASFL